MVSSAASTVADYLTSLPPDRRAAIARVREVVNARLPRGYEETMQHGMISWIVPRSRLAETYNGQALPLASLASQKQYMALYLMTIYGDSKLHTWFKAAYQASGKKLDMGKACVRFKTLDALPLDVIGEAVSRVPVDAYVAIYEASRSRTVKPKPVAARSRTEASARAKPAARSRSSSTAKAKPAVRRVAASAPARPAAPRATKPGARSASRRAKPAARPARSRVV
jgi:Domain of unknown function (DU1801)